ncbi:unnamed protein product [Cunninghamella blakesleeana]
MYNGIGLTTPRGSGTNGYVVRNLSHVQSSIKKKQRYDDIKEISARGKKPNEELLLHDRKRKIEVDCMKLRLKLEDEGLNDSDIDTKVDEFRKSMLLNFDQVKPREAKNLQEHETHLLQAAKNEENIKFANALGIKQGNDYVEGAAFDRELQERKKLERMEKRQIEMEEKAKRYEQRERENRRMNKSRRDEQFYKEKKLDLKGKSRSSYRSVSPYHRELATSRSPSPSRNKRQRRNYSRSRSPSYSRSRSRSPSYSRSRSRSPSYSRSRSRSRSPNYSRSRSRSHSGRLSSSD